MRGKMNQLGRGMLSLVRALTIAIALNQLTSANVAAQISGELAAPQKQLSISEPQPKKELVDSGQTPPTDNLEKLRGEVDSIRNVLFYGGGFLALIVAALTIQSSTLAWLSDRRTATLHALTVKGEEASQKRAETIHLTFLDESHKTIGLVNATLQLAKDATERTTKVWEERAFANLKELDTRARSLLSDVTVEKARDLVRDVRQQEKIKALAQDITLFESNRLFFADKFPLTPYCRFVRGVYSHMTQDFTEAINEWEAIRIDPNSSKLLLALASYWIGVEYDTLGAFEKAIATFESTRNYVDGVARFDIERLIIESMFSNMPIERTETLIKPLENLREGSTSEQDSRAKAYVLRRINIALGNIMLQVAKRYRKNDSESAAGEYFRGAADKFRATKEDQWALLGLAECLYYLGEAAEARDIFIKSKLNAENEFKRRKEPRSQVLAKTAELLCCARVLELREFMPLVSETLTRSLMDVHPRLTVYSAFEKRNVSKETFENQLTEFMSDYELGLDAALALESSVKGSVG